VEAEAVRHLLVVSHFFPPMGGGGVQRVTKLVKYLEPQGWRVTVVAGRPEDYWMQDPALLADLPESCRVLRVAAPTGLGVLRRVGRRGGGSSRRSSRLFAGLRRLSAWTLVPDSYVGWRAAALRAAREVLATDPPAAVLSTSPPETNHLVARALHREAHLPWLADFRDPWFALHLYPAPTPWHRARHARLERAVLHDADSVTTTTAWLADLLRGRGRPGLGVALVRNGFDPADFDTAPRPARDPRSPLRLVHTGMLTLTRSAEGLLRGLRRLHELRPELGDALEIELVGARESRNDALVAALGLGSCVRLRDYVSHPEAVAAMRDADVLVLIKHVEPRFRGLVPGKLYEYMGAGRPLLALVPESEAADLVRDLAWGEVAPPDDPEAIAAALARLAERHRAGTLAQAYARNGRERFERPSQARAFAALLESIAEAGPKNPQGRP
jgi:glycosyltransferase involved in cell wall biosynthesis